MYRHQGTNQSIREKTNSTANQQVGLKKSKSLKPRESPRKERKNSRNTKVDLSTYQNDLRSLSNDIRSYGMSKTLLLSGKNKRKRVKFKSKLLEIVEIQSFKQFFDEDQEEDNTQDFVPLAQQAAKKAARKDEETPVVVPNFNHKMNSNPENRAKCCVCNIF